MKLSDCSRAARLAAYISASVLICLAVMTAMPVHGEADIYSDVIRLHVLARSDSDHDQAVKLAVRDAVLAYIEKLTAGGEPVGSVEEMHKLIESDLDGIKACAEECALGYYDKVEVSVTLSREKYPKRDYNEISLPSGAYDSLRVVIDGGAGHNWWCVLYPPLCISMASVGVRVDEPYLKREEAELIKTDSKKYRIRFKLLEIIADIFGFEY